jgi:hypothetical protein
MLELPPNSRVQRRHLLVIATSKFSDGWVDIGEGVLEEIETARRLFSGPLNYDSITVLHNKSSAELPDRIAQWSREERIAPDDFVVGYCTGHGVAYAGQLRIITPEIPESRKHVAISLADLVVNISKAGDNVLNNVLLIVDTCQSGGGEQSALDTARALRNAEAGTARGAGLFVIATARSIESARPGNFIAAMERVVLNGSAGEPQDEFLGPAKLVDRINEDLASSGVEDVQHADLSGRTERDLAFFPNPLWAPRLRTAMGQELAQRALDRMQVSDMRGHWSPRARGVSVDSEPGWYYTGRGWAMREVLQWVARATIHVEHGAGLVVSGPAGIGKSALLARLVTLAHPVHRSRADSAGVLGDIPPDELPPEGLVNVAVHARAKKADELALEITVALGGSLAGASDDLLGAVLSAISTASSGGAPSGGESSKRYIVIVIDALDEADDPKRCAQLLSEVVQAPYPTRLLVGLRQLDVAPSPLEAALGDGFASLRLGRWDLSDSDDLARFVLTYLRARPGSPDSEPEQEQQARTVATAIADRAKSSFLIASRVASALASRATVATALELPRLPSTVAEAFELDLRRFGDVGRRRAEFVFGALAFGWGRGLPRSLWPSVASGLAGTRLSEAHLTEWLTDTGQYVIEDKEFGEPVLRLYHEAFAEFLRDKVEAACLARGTESSVVVAATLAAEVPVLANGARDWLRAASYVLAYLPAHLMDASQAIDDFTAAAYNVQLKHLPADANWVAAKQARFGDPFLLLNDVTIGIAAAMGGHLPPDIPMLVRLCAAGGHLVGRAPPLVVDALARAGDLRWAIFLAENAHFPLDRCRSMTWLAQRLAEQGSLDEAVRCLVGLDATIAAVTGSYKAMARSWWVDAAISIKQFGAAQAMAETALKEAQEALANPNWHAGKMREREHLVFWTARCASASLGDDGLRLVRPLTAQLTAFPWNLDLQIAATVGNVEFLNRELKAHREPVGNLALALASAGRTPEAMDLLRHARPEVVFADNLKRAAWAWALCGQWEQAFDVALSIEHHEEALRSLHRIQEEAARQANSAVVNAAADHALEQLVKFELAVGAPNTARRSTSRRSAQLARMKSSPKIRAEAKDHWRMQAWASHIAAVAQRFETALELAQAVCSLNVPSTAENCLAYPTYYSARRRMHVTSQTPADPSAFTAALRSAKRLGDLTRLREIGEELQGRTSDSEWSVLGNCMADMATLEDPRGLWMEGLHHAANLGPGEVDAVASLLPLVPWDDWPPMTLSDLSLALDDGNRIAARIGNWSARQ